MEHRKKIQHVCATSRYALPVTLIYSVLMLLPAIGINIANQVLAFLLITVATFPMVELNNRNALIRIYSRMVSCSFLVLMMMSRFLLGDYRNGIVAVGIIVAYLILFKAYQDKQSMGLMFYASVIIGFTSFAWIQVLVFMPVIWIFSIFNLQCMSVRSWIASILGVTLPYWLVIVGSYLNGTTTVVIARCLAQLHTAHGMVITGLDIHKLVSLTWIAILALTGTIHFLRHSYNDSIHVRMLFEIFIFTGMCTLVMILFSPEYFEPLLTVLIINVSPLISHYMTLTNTKITNISFYFIVAITIFITIFNTWTL